MANDPKPSENCQGQTGPEKLIFEVFEIRSKEKSSVSTRIGTNLKNHRECTYEEKIRVVYGFETILPHNTSKKGEN